MDRLRRGALLTRLIAELERQGCPPTERAIQRSVYLLQERHRVALGFDFIARFGRAYSSELRDELTALRADGWVRILPRPFPRYAPTDECRRWHGLYARTLARYGAKISAVALDMASPASPGAAPRAHAR